MDVKTFKRIFLLLIPLLLMTEAVSHAGYFEWSIGLGYNRSNFGGNNYSWNRRYGTSVGYHFTETSGLEFSYQDVTDRTYIAGYEDTTFHDQVYGVNWLQGLADKSWAVQPYLRAGVGLLNRTATGNYANGAAPASVLDTITGIIGAGARIYLTKTFAIRVEGTSYLVEGKFDTWDDNFAINFGVSVYF